MKLFKKTTAAGDAKDNGKTEEGQAIASVKINGKDVKIINTATVLEIRAHKLEDGRELSEVVAHEFMMVDHKKYLVRLLTDAIMTVVRATKREPLIKLASQAMFNKLRRQAKANRRGMFGRK
jgi:hypothetical protein